QTRNRYDSYLEIINNSTAVKIITIMLAAFTSEQNC
ncbi:MAG: hypothetical protein ACI9HJ_002052, partial [Ulvibacter sp.]